MARKPRVRSARPRRLQRHWPRAARLLLLALGIALASAAGLAPTALGADSVYWTNIAGVRVADLDGTGTPVDLFADGGAPQGVALDPSFMQDDGLHPNARGEPAVLDTLWRYLEPLLHKNR